MLKRLRGQLSAFKVAKNMLGEAASTRRYVRPRMPCVELMSPQTSAYDVPNQRIPLPAPSPQYDQLQLCERWQQWERKCAWPQTSVAGPTSVSASASRLMPSAQVQLGRTLTARPARFWPAPKSSSSVRAPAREKLFAKNLVNVAPIELWRQQLQADKLQEQQQRQQQNQQQLQNLKVEQPNRKHNTLQPMLQMGTRINPVMQREQEKFRERRRALEEHLKQGPQRAPLSSLFHRKAK